MAKKSFEESMNRLDIIVDTLEKNEIGLEDSLKLFEEGLKLVKQLDGDLKVFESKVQELIEKEDEENA